ncbi:MAG: threonylcarbamoyl-AMP synthase [Clostridiales Family XIII bacterium]|nr:threonylcarbamoyl-AMP synthase [Clostridiales Family XIII bacterium]
MTKIYYISDINNEMMEKADVFGDIEASKSLAAALASVDEAAGIIRSGGLVAFPTETVYGLGADAFNEEAVRKVYAAKGRPSDNPMIVHIARASDIGVLSDSLSPRMVKLIDAFWPGPLTLVVSKRLNVPDVVTGGLDTVAVRMPDNPAAIELIRRAGSPIAAPSANLSGKPSPTKYEHVVRDMDGRIDAILAGDDCRVGIESTVVDITGEVPVILRPGIISADEIAAVIDARVDIDAAVYRRGSACEGFTDAGAANNESAGSLAPRAPGMKYRHYAPEAEMIVLEGERAKVRKETERLKLLNEKLGRKVGVLLFEEKTFVEAAHDFFAELRTLDAEETDLIIAGALSEKDGVGFAVMNRMMKAAGYNIIRV